MKRASPRCKSRRAGSIPTPTEENAQIKQIVGLLVKHGAPLDLFSAVAIGDEQQVRQLLQHDPQSANARGQTATRLSISPWA